MDGISLKPSLAAEAGLLECALRRNVFSIAGHLNSERFPVAECCGGERTDSFWHKALAPVRAGKDVAYVNRSLLQPSFDHSDGEVRFLLRDDIRQPISRAPRVNARPDELFRLSRGAMWRPDHEATDLRSWVYEPKITAASAATGARSRRREVVSSSGSRRLIVRPNAVLVITRNTCASRVPSLEARKAPCNLKPSLMRIRLSQKLGT